MSYSLIPDIFIFTIDDHVISAGNNLNLELVRSRSDHIAIHRLNNPTIEQTYAIIEGELATKEITNLGVALELARQLWDIEADVFTMHHPDLGAVLIYPENDSYLELDKPKDISDTRGLIVNTHLEDAPLLIVFTPSIVRWDSYMDYPIIFKETKTSKIINWLKSIIASTTVRNIKYVR